MPHGPSPIAVPDVLHESLDVALNAIRASGLRASVAMFSPIRNGLPEQGWGRLENYRVVSQSPRIGRELQFGRVVTLTLDTPRFRGPLGSLAIPAGHPKYVQVPDLLGQSYGRAMAAGDGTGVFVRVGATGALTPAASTCGLNGFVVSAQSPPPGTRVLWEGVKPRSVNPRLATVTITLRSR